MSVEVCLNGLDKVVEGGSSLKSAGGQYGSDSFGPAAAVFAMGSLGDVEVDDHETDGWFELWGDDELEVGCAIFTQTLGNTLGIGRGRNVALCLRENTVAHLCE